MHEDVPAFLFDQGSNLSKLLLSCKSCKDVVVVKETLLFKCQHKGQRVVQ